MKIILMAALLSSLASAVYATQQVPEVLVYNGTTNDMFTTPLESFFSAEKPKVFLEKPSSTACWRGYVGTWKIENDELYLVALQEGHPRTGAISLDKASPKWVSPVKATWFTGTIQIGKGGGRAKVLTGSLEIKDGKVVATQQVDSTTQKKEAEQESGHVRNVADDLKHPHGEWASVTSGVSIALGPRDSNTFVSSDIVLNIYVKFDGDTPPELVGAGLQLDIAVPEEREGGVAPHVGTRHNENLSWKKTDIKNVHMASLFTVRLTPRGRWGAAVTVPMKVDGKLITVTTETYYFTVR